MTILFGDYLTRLMQERGDIAAAAMARHLAVDGRQVRRWLHNQAVPKLSSDYVPKIADFLALSSAERSRLEEVQISSLRAQKAARPRMPERPLHHRANPSRLLSQYEHARSSAAVPSHLPAGWAPALASGTPIRGPERVVAAAIDLVIRTWELSTPHENTIYLSFQGAQSLFESSTLHPAWQHALCLALDRGWDVCHLLRLDRNAQRSIDLVDEMLVYLGKSGTYQPYYFNRYGTLPAPCDFLIVPSLGALVFFATEQDQRVDAAIYLHGAESLDLLLAAFSQLRMNCRPLFTSFSRQAGLPAFFDAHAEMERRAGNRYLFKDGLSDITRPPSFYQVGSPWLHVARVADEPLDTTIQRWNTRLQAFHAHIRTYTYWDMHPRRALEQLLRDGTYARDYRHVPSDFALEPAQRLEHARNIAHLLRTCDNYHVAFVEEHEERDFFRTFWQVMGDHTVLLEAGIASNHEGLLTITEGTIAAAFRSYAEDVWEQVAPHHQDKPGHVIPWLEDQIRRFADVLGVNESPTPY